MLQPSWSLSIQFRNSIKFVKIQFEGSLYLQPSLPKSVYQANLFAYLEDQTHLHGINLCYLGSVHPQYTWFCG